MLTPTKILFLSGFVLLAGCDIALPEEAKSKIEETKQAASALKQDASQSLDAVQNTLSGETKTGTGAAPAEATAAAESEGSSQYIDEVKKKVEDVGNMKVSELLNLGGNDENEKEAGKE